MSKSEQASSSERDDGMEVERYGIQLQGYITALRTIADVLKGSEESTPLDGEIHVKLLKATARDLQKALNSEIVFLADEDGKIFYRDPQNKALKREELPDTKQVQGLKKDGIPLVADRSYGHPPELKRLGLDSLLLLRLETPLGFRYIGFGNGSNNPPYLTVDRDFVNEMMRIYSYALTRGKEIAAVDNARANYFLSRRSGNWERLAIGARSYFNLLLD